MTTENNRTPAVYLPHGGGPWPFVDMGLPKAEIWEEDAPTVMTSACPPMLFDYYGFPPESYALEWPAPGDPALAERVRTLLGAAGFSTATDPKRGFDHGTFVPLRGSRRPKRSTRGSASCGCRRITSARERRTLVDSFASAGTRAPTTVFVPRPTSPAPPQ